MKRLLYPAWIARNLAIRYYDMAKGVLATGVDTLKHRHREPK